MNNISSVNHAMLVLNILIIGSFNLFNYSGVSIIKNQSWVTSVTRKKLPNVYKIGPKMILLEKW